MEIVFPNAFSISGDPNFAVAVKGAGNVRIAVGRQTGVVNRPIGHGGISVIDGKIGAIIDTAIGTCDVDNGMDRFVVERWGCPVCPSSAAIGCFEYFIVVRSIWISQPQFVFIKGIDGDEHAPAVAVGTGQGNPIGAAVGGFPQSTGAA